MCLKSFEATATSTFQNDPKELCGNTSLLSGEHSLEACPCIQGGVCGRVRCLFLRVHTLGFILCSAGVALATWDALWSADSRAGDWLCRLAVHFLLGSIIRSQADQSVCPSVF